jgi:TonB family protein
MGIFASLLSNAVIAAAPATPLPWFTFDNYPVKAFEREWQGATTFSLLVGPDGRPANCTVVKSSGHDMLDKQACWVAMKKPRFTPALGPNGEATYGVYRSQVVWARPDREFVQQDPGPDMVVRLGALPAGTIEPAAVKLAYYVDAEGIGSDCTVLPESERQPKQLVELACNALLTRPPVVNQGLNGTKVPVVRTAAVQFEPPK